MIEKIEKMLKEEGFIPLDGSISSIDVRVFHGSPELRFEALLRISNNDAK